MIWYSNDAKIDFENIVPVFLHIRECRNLRNLDLRFDGKHNFRLTKTTTPARLEVSPNPAFIDLFAGQNISLTVLCGINGIGKTTILNLLAGRMRDESSFLVLFSDSRGGFLSNEPIDIQSERGKLLRVDRRISWTDVSLSGLCSNQVLHEDDEEFHILKNIAADYVRHRALYDDAGEPLFTHVSVEFWRLDSRCDEVASHLNHSLGWDVDRHTIEPYLKKHPVFFAFLTAAQDNTFDGLFEWVKKQQKPPANLEELHSFLDGLDPDGVIERSVLELVSKPVLVENKSSLSEMGPTVTKLRMEEDFSQATPIEEYDNARRRLHELSERVIAAVTQFTGEMGKMLKHHFHVWPYGLTRILYLEPLRIMGRNRRRLYDLSSGEFMDVENRFELHPCMAQFDSCWLYRDEPDVHLHPEWKRQYIAKLVRSIDATRSHLVSRDSRYGRKRYAFILTTHSPFILSDVMAEQTILLDRDQDGRTFVRESSTGTFAGNIGAMFYDQFFMKETIGKYAEATIAQAIDRIESAEPMSAGETNDFRRLFAAVGDILLRKLLVEKLERRIREKN